MFDGGPKTEDGVMRPPSSVSRPSCMSDVQAGKVSTVPLRMQPHTHFQRRSPRDMIGDTRVLAGSASVCYATTGVCYGERCAADYKDIYGRGSANPLPQLP